MSKQLTMDCIVIGGCADGVLLKDMRADAQFIELKRPDHIKPIEDSNQVAPEVIHEKDQYEIHPIGLRNTDDAGTRLFGMAVLKGESLTAGMSELIIGYVESVTTKMIAAGVITTN